MIDWSVFEEPHDVEEAIRHSLPQNATDIDVFKLLTNAAEYQMHDDTITAWIDGPSYPDSPVECEWMIDFKFKFPANTVTDIHVEKNLIGP